MRLLYNVLFTFVNQSIVISAFFESVHWILLIVLFFFFEFLCSLPKCHKNILKSGLFMVCLQVLPIRNHFRNIKQLFTQTLKLL